MAVTRLDDPNHELLAGYRSVADPELATRRGLFVAEGRLVVRRLLTESPFGVESVLVTDTAYEAIRDALDQRPSLPVLAVSQEVMNGVAGFNIHRGCLALGRRQPARDWRTLTIGARRLVVLERVGNADNVGAAFRNGRAFGVDAVLLGPSCADPLYRKAIRTSMGAALMVPFATVADAWPGALCELTASGFAVIAMTPDADAPPFHDVAAPQQSRPLAIVLGHEGEGLTADALAACGLRARIPMQPGADSLNVATALAIALYESER